MKMKCDFCDSPSPKFQFRNPAIHCTVFCATFEPGYFAACADCAILLEDDRLAELVERVVKMQNAGKLGRLYREELLAVYSQVSRLREPLQ
jgi:hypothetical protein